MTLETHRVLLKDTTLDELLLDFQKIKINEDLIHENEAQVLS